MTAEPTPLARRRVIVHVGLPKTGSTAFQDCAEAPRDIIEGAGVTLAQKDVTQDFRRCAIAISRQGSSLLRKARLNTAARHLRAHADEQGRDSILITDEALLGGVRKINAIEVDKDLRLQAVNVLKTMHSDLTDGASRAAYGRVK